MISFVSESTGATRQLQQGIKLGEGSSGKVFNLVDENQDETGLVCKQLHISPKMQFSKRQVLLLTINELNMLRKLKLLEGYQREGDNFYLIMKKVEGILGGKFKPENKPRILFKGLRDLHRKNVAHLDCHDDNYIISSPTSSTPKAHAIDFGFAEEITYANFVLDMMIFSTVANLPSFKALLNFYVADMIEHVKNHKFETCQRILFTGALTLASIYGIPLLGITHLMVSEFIYTLFLHQIGQELTSKSLNVILKYLLAKHIHHKKMANAISFVMKTIKFSLFFYLTVSQLSYHWLQAGSNIKAGIFSKATPENLLHTGLLYYPFSQLFSRLNKICDNTITPECILKKKADLLFKYYPSYTYGLFAKNVPFQNNKSKVTFGN